MTKDSLVARRPFSNNDDSNKWQLKSEKCKFGDHKTLGFLTAKQMINRFLTCDRIIKIEKKCSNYNREELAKRLGITLKEFTSLRSQSSYKSIASKVTLPLANLYCSTEWADDK